MILVVPLIIDCVSDGVVRVSWPQLKQIDEVPVPLMKIALSCVFENSVAKESSPSNPRRTIELLIPSVSVAGCASWNCDVCVVCVLITFGDNGKSSSFAYCLSYQK